MGSQCRTCLSDRLGAAWGSGSAALCAWLMTWIAFGTTGCARRAYTDLYIENMASEIRELEDQLYEYDYEYRLLEQKLAALRAENARLRNLVQTAEKPSGSVVQPRSERSPDESRKRPLDSILEMGESLRQKRSQTATDRDQQADRTKEGQTPAGDEFNLDSLKPPKIEGGEQVAPEELVDPTQDAGALRVPGDINDPLVAESTRISIPAALAVDRRAAGTNSTDAASSARDGADELQLKTEEPITDLRVVELAFHPTLSRAANFDEELDDDGLFVILQPLNAQGQMVPVAADLSVVILDPAREGDQARIGRWDYSATEVKSMMRTVGDNKGIHLTLPWQGPSPIADRVLVFVRYTFPDGRQVIGEKTFFVSGAGGMRTTWVPRGEDRSPRAVNTNRVVPAGFVPSEATAELPPRANGISGLEIVRPDSSGLPAQPPSPPAGEEMP